MKVSMKARRGFVYAGKRLRAGDQFQARGESDARILAGVGHAERVVVVGDSAAVYETRVMTSRPTVVLSLDMVDLDRLDRDQLHALARARGIHVHHRAGAERVRELLKAAE